MSVFKNLCCNWLYLIKMNTLNGPALRSCPQLSSVALTTCFQERFYEARPKYEVNFVRLHSSLCSTETTVGDRRFFRSFVFPTRQELEASWSIWNMRNNESARGMYMNWEGAMPWGCMSRERVAGILTGLRAGRPGFDSRYGRIFCILKASWNPSS
jgi:hypothetical protein